MNRNSAIRRFAKLAIVATLATIGGTAGSLAAEPTGKDVELVKPRSVRALVADGKHNAFTALAHWKDAYWLAFRKAQGHNSSDGVIVVLRSADAKDWAQELRLKVLADDRDPQILATPSRLFLYDPAMEGGTCASFVTYSDDGKTWSKPRPVYQPQFIFWKPIAHGGRFFATAHRKAEGNDGGTVRESHLITSTDGLGWTKVSTIRAGNWESETTLHFESDTRLVAFLRQKYSTPGFILESSAPFTAWTQRPAGIHLSGHSVATFEGTTYLFSRSMGPQGNGTMIYTWAGGQLQPYCALPSGGDCSYPGAVRIGHDEMLVSYYSSHEGSTNIYLARVPLKKGEKPAVSGAMREMQAAVPEAQRDPHRPTYRPGVCARP